MTNRKRVVAFEDDTGKAVGQLAELGNIPTGSAVYCGEFGVSEGPDITHRLPFETSNSLKNALDDALVRGAAGIVLVVGVPASANQQLPQ